LTPRWVKAAAMLAVVAPMVAFASIFTAIMLSPWFSWTGNALSDLGVGGASTTFNLGLIASGLMLIPLPIALYTVSEGGLGRLSAILLLLSAILLSSIGFFPESCGRLHYYVSAAFFLTLPLTIYLYAASTYRSSRRGALLSALSATVALGVWLLSWSSPAIPEAISALSATIWVEGVALRLLMSESRSPLHG